MTLEEAMTEEAEVTHAEAIAEVERHGINPTEFLLEMGHKDSYQASEVLGWLGY